MGGSDQPFRSRTPKELAEQIRRAEESTTAVEFDASVSSLLADLLGGYNSRDAELVRERLAEIKSALEDSIEGTLDQLFGGSVAKHTYIDGLSDIDSLLVINDSTLEEQGPTAAIDKMESILRNALSPVSQVSHGNMAVTVEYPDGMVIQLLPTLTAEDGTLRVPSSRRDGWSHIDPKGFREALSRRNEEVGHKLIPVIKLAKAMLGTLPESQQLSGYHVESMAIAAFKNYSGPQSATAMLPHLFERGRNLVLSPIRDSTGQSLHVDDYLGKANSDSRVAASHVLGRLAKRMRNATTAGSIEQWRALFGLDH